MSQHNAKTAAVILRNLKVIEMTEMETCRFALIGLKARQRELRSELSFLNETKREIEQTMKGLRDAPIAPIIDGTLEVQPL